MGRGMQCSAPALVRGLPGGDQVRPALVLIPAPLPVRLTRHPSSPSVRRRAPDTPPYRSNLLVAPGLRRVLRSAAICNLMRPKYRGHPRIATTARSSTCPWGWRAKVFAFSGREHASRARITVERRDPWARGGCDSLPAWRKRRSSPAAVPTCGSHRRRHAGVPTLTVSLLAVAHRVGARSGTAQCWRRCAGVAQALGIGRAPPGTGRQRRCSSIEESGTRPRPNTKGSGSSRGRTVR